MGWWCHIVLPGMYFPYNCWCPAQECVGVECLSMVLRGLDRTGILLVYPSPSCTALAGTAGVVSALALEFSQQIVLGEFNVRAEASRGDPIQNSGCYVSHGPVSISGGPNARDWATSEAVWYLFCFLLSVPDSTTELGCWEGDKCQPATIDRTTSVPSPHSDVRAMGKHSLLMG